MAAAILALFSDPARARAMGDAARDFVRKSWTWEAHFLRLEADMLAALDEKDGKPHTSHR